MTPSVLLLSALLALSSASLPDIVKRNVVKRSVDSEGDLEWLTWTGGLPNGAVSIYNDNTHRRDYVCKAGCEAGCEAGFYSPDLGSYCRYPYGGHEYKATMFQILANKDNIEFLEWKKSSHGWVPKDSIQTCPGVDIYVAKNKYGLGKVHRRHGSFFLPLKGKEHRYRSYEVLVINRDYYAQKISNVKYAINNAAIFRHPPETMTNSSTTNNACRAVVKTVTLSKTSRVERTWNIGHSTKLGITTTITAEIPFTVSVGVELTAEKTMESSRGTTMVDQLSRSLTVELTVPPNHSCNVRMEGRKMTADIPYTARLSRTYRGGKTRWTSISGTYKGVQMGEVRAVVDPCEPVAGAKPCP
ncbi:natterin-4-like isoform X2 [Cololabis saira]|nr:natterin-4-like isoform X2 [Cololabis saira]